MPVIDFDEINIRLIEEDHRPATNEPAEIINVCRKLFSSLSLSLSLSHTHTHTHTHTESI
jgi:hypothetical protein